MKRKSFMLAIWFAVAPAVPLLAIVTPLDYYSLGENDFGVSNNQRVTVTLDNIQPHPLTAAGSPVYSTLVAPGAAVHDGSSLCVSFNGSGQYLTNGFPINFTSNFGIEAWIKINTDSDVQNRIIAYNGNTSFNGWGLMQVGNQVHGLYGGVVEIGSSASISVGVWTHVALINDGGTAKIYVNGTLAGQAVAAPNPPTGGFAIGAPPQDGSAQNFNGFIDEVRVFVFLPGQFSTGDLLVNTPHDSFVQFPNPGLPAFVQSSVTWGDYDHDGRLDLLLSGSLDFIGNSLPSLWRNNGNNTFSNISSGLPQAIVNGSVAWGDFNNDGLLDVLFTGQSLASGFLTQLWRNNGNGSFSLINAGLPQLSASSAAWGDFDNDGRLDFLLTGHDSGFLPVTQLWRNNGNGTFSVTNVGLPAVHYSSVAWGDYDNDGFPDILLSGLNSSGQPITQVWRNNGNGTFSDISAGLTGLDYSSVAWGDYDNDGRLDILITGMNDQSAPVAQVWRNLGSNTFSNIYANIPPMYGGSVAWGDYDNDGRLDVVLTGQTSSGTYVSGLYRNNGDGSFTYIPTDLPYLASSSLAWGDLDGDGSLDISLTGEDSQGHGIVGIWQNQALVLNAPPTAPTGLRAAASGASVILSWDPATDSKTPAGGLSYNLRVGTTPGGGDIISPMSTPNGHRLLLARGNVEHRLSRTLPLAPGKTIYWSVQAVDTSFAGSAFAPEQQATLSTVLTPPNGIPVAGDLNGDGVVDQSELNTVLQNYWIQNKPLLGSPASLGNGQFVVGLDNGGGASFSVLATTNVALPLSSWEILGQGAPAFQFTDTNAAKYPHRFYLLRWP